MDSTLFEKLEDGDLVRRDTGGYAYIVHRFGKRLVGVSMIELTNPRQWDRLEVRRPGKESP